METKGRALTSIRPIGEVLLDRDIALSDMYDKAMYDETEGNESGRPMRLLGDDI